MWNEYLFLVLVWFKFFSFPISTFFSLLFLITDPLFRILNQAPVIIQVELTSPIRPISTWLKPVTPGQLKDSILRTARVIPKCACNPNHVN